MKDIIVKRPRRKVDYLRIIKTLGLLGDFVDYIYVSHPRHVSTRRQARYFLQYKKVDIWTVDVFLSQHPEIVGFDMLFKALNGNIKDCYL